MNALSNEQRVDKMIEAGRNILVEAEQYLGKKCGATVAAFSGGGDSIVATHFANMVRPSCVTFNANTLVHLQPTRDHIDRVIEKFGWNAEIIEATAEGAPRRTETNGDVVDNWIDGETAYEEYVLNHGFAGPAMHARMYQRLKERPLMRLRRKINEPGKRMIVISGIRHDESAIRAGYKRAFQDCPKQGVMWVNPFYYHTAEHFELYRQEFGLPSNPVKRMCGISGECCCGAFGSKDERLAYADIDTGFVKYLDALENRVKERFPWGWGESPPKWWMAKKRGQGFLFPVDEDKYFQPMCVGCVNGRR